MYDALELIQEMNLRFFWACCDSIPFDAQEHAFDEVAMYMAGGEL